MSTEPPSPEGSPPLIGDVLGAAKVIGPLASASADLLTRTFGPAADELGLYFSDRVRQWRVRNLEKVVGRFEEAVDGRPVSAVPPRTLFPLIEAASGEDDPTLQDMWATLLASAALEVHEGVPPSLVVALRQLSPHDAEVLQRYFTFRGIPRRDVSQISIWSIEQPVRERTLVSLDALIAAGVIQRPPIDLNHELGDLVKAVERLNVGARSGYRLNLGFRRSSVEELELTSLGEALVLAVCRPFDPIREPWAEDAQLSSEAIWRWIRAVRPHMRSSRISVETRERLGESVARGEEIIRQRHPDQQSDN